VPEYLVKYSFNDCLMVISVLLVFIIKTRTAVTMAGNYRIATTR
jgi:hypothetical protein